MADFTINDLAATSGLSASHNIELQQTPGEGSVRASLPTVADYLQTLLQNELLPFPGYVTGGTRFYNNTPRFAAGGAATQTLNVIHYTPMYIRRRVTMDRVFVQTGTGNATAGNVKIGVYENNNGVPGALIDTIVTSFAVPATAGNGLIATPDALTFTLDPGFYWYATITDATVILTGAGQASGYASFDFGTTNNSALFAATSQQTGYTEAGSFAAGFPANATPVGTTAALTTGGFRVQ